MRGREGTVTRGSVSAPSREEARRSSAWRRAASSRRKARLSTSVASRWRASGRRERACATGQKAELVAARREGAAARREVAATRSDGAVFRSEGAWRSVGGRKAARGVEAREEAEGARMTIVGYRRLGGHSKRRSVEVEKVYCHVHYHL